MQQRAKASRLAVPQWLSLRDTEPVQATATPNEERATWNCAIG